jgi:hypothetical protein
VAFRTKVITKGVDPQLHCYYRSARLKQYFKEHRALRTETVISDTRVLSSWRGPWTSRRLYFLRCDKGFIA